MDQCTQAATPPSTAKRVLRRLYTANPFYILSADLVFVGLRMSFDTSGQTFQTGALLLALLGYTLLLATTAVVLIRLGNVWDDVRTILLLVVAMFLAMSITFDETLASRPRLGQLLYLGGFLFAVVVSEGLLHGIRLRLPALFRLPYYLILGLFFLYPIALSPLLRYPDSPLLQWMLFGFSPLAGLVFLSLLSAVRKGPDYLSKNGSPWRYPLYPWVLFGLLAAAVCGRSYYLCLSLHFVERSGLGGGGRFDTIFGLYFLVPFLLALAFVWFQASMVARNRAAQRAVLLTLPGLLMLAAVGHRSDPVYQGFLTMFRTGLGGTPLFLTSLALIGFYGFAALRRAPTALTGLTLAMLSLVVIGPRTMDLDTLVSPRPLPMFLVALLHFGLLWKRRDSWRAAFAALSLIGSITTLMGSVGFHGYEFLTGFHLMLLAAIAIGMAFDDPFARVLRHASASCLASACVLVAWAGPDLGLRIAPEWISAYPVLVIVALAGLCYGTRSGSYRLALMVGVAGWLVASGGRGYASLRRWVIGLDWITGGLAFFALAAIISLGKAGTWPKRVLRRVARSVDP